MAGEDVFLLNDYLIKGNWGEFSDEKVEAMRSTMPKNIELDPDGVVYYVSFMEWLEKAKKKYEEQNFFKFIGEKIKRKFIDAFKM